MGQMHWRANVMTNEDIIAGWKLRIFGYISIGDSVWKHNTQHKYTADAVAITL